MLYYKGNTSIFCRKKKASNESEPAFKTSPAPGLDLFASLFSFPLQCVNGVLQQGSIPFSSFKHVALLIPRGDGHIATLPALNSPNLNAGNTWKWMFWQKNYLCLTLALNAEPKQISFH